MCIFRQYFTRFSDTPANTGEKNTHGSTGHTTHAVLPSSENWQPKKDLFRGMKPKNLYNNRRGDLALPSGFLTKTLGTEGTPSVEPVDIISLKKMFGLVEICKNIFPVAAREHGLAQNIHTAGMVD